MFVGFPDLNIFANYRNGWHIEENSMYIYRASFDLAI